MTSPCTARGPRHEKSPNRFHSTARTIAADTVVRDVPTRRFLAIPRPRPPLLENCSESRSGAWARLPRSAAPRQTLGPQATPTPLSLSGSAVRALRSPEPAPHVSVAAFVSSVPSSCRDQLARAQPHPLRLRPLSIQGLAALDAVTRRLRQKADQLPRAPGLAPLLAPPLSSPRLWAPAPACRGMVPPNQVGCTAPHPCRELPSSRNRHSGSPRCSALPPSRAAPWHAAHNCVPGVRTRLQFLVPKGRCLFGSWVGVSLIPTSCMNETLPGAIRPADEHGALAGHRVPCAQGRSLPGSRHQALRRAEVGCYEPAPVQRRWAPRQPRARPPKTIAPCQAQAVPASRGDAGQEQGRSKTARDAAGRRGGGDGCERGGIAGPRVVLLGKE